jgi:hypothetical protein
MAVRKGDDFDLGLLNEQSQEQKDLQWSPNKISSWNVRNNLNASPLAIYDRLYKSSE